MNIWKTTLLLVLLFTGITEKEKKVIYVNFELPKSFVVTEDKVYVSPLNTSTLLKRTKTGVNL